MTRVLVVCLLTVMLIQPAAARKGPSSVEQVTNRPHFLEAIVGPIYGEAMASWMRPHTLVSNSAIRPSRTPPTSFYSARGTFSQCSQMLALGPDPRCASACDAAKESCDRQCSSARAKCLDLCLGIGFACDYYCQAAYFLCRPNCSRAHDACMFDCPTRGAER